MKINDYLLACRPYLNKDLMMGGHPVPADAGQQCDNHAMFTAEYLRIAKDIDPSYKPSNHVWEFEHNGQLYRYITSDSALDLSPDDYLGYLNYCNLYDQQSALRLLDFGRANWGSYTSPWSTVGFLWRQPQLWCACLAAAGKLRFYHLPLVIYTALVILVAGHGASPIADQDTRRLSWHLIQVMKGVSWLCRQAAKVWWRRLRSQYGEDGMRIVFARYFDASHPFARFAVNELER